MSQTSSGECVLIHCAARHKAVTRACIFDGSLSMVACSVNCAVTGTLPPMYLSQMAPSVPSNNVVPQPCSSESFNSEIPLTSTSTCLVLSEPSMVSTLPAPIQVTLVSNPITSI